jgi:CheY-like chemotaxis protein
MTTKKPGIPSSPPPASGAPTVRPGTSGRPPSNVRDAMTEAHAIAGGALGRATAPPQSSSTARKTVLIVDDDPSMRQRLKSALDPWFEVVEARDGMEAVELISKLPPPAMIVSDVMMPRVDGFTLAKILRGNPVMKKVPIMFVSSRNTPQDVTQALVLGACQYVPKTTPVGEIVAKIRKIVV